MAQQSLLVTGALCRLYLNNKIFTVTQSISIELDQGTYPVYGINSPDAQELATGQRSIRGTVKGVRVKQSGGLQGSNAIPLFSDLAAGSMISLRLEDRSTNETLFSIPKCRIVRITESVQAKGLYLISFDFVGILLHYPLDLS